MLKFSHSLTANANPPPHFDCIWSSRGGGGFTDRKAQLRQSKHYFMLICISCQVTRGHMKQTQAFHGPYFIFQWITHVQCIFSVSGEKQTIFISLFPTCFINLLQLFIMMAAAPSFFFGDTFLLVFNSFLVCP